MHVKQNGDAQFSFILKMFRTPLIIIVMLLTVSMPRGKKIDILSPRPFIVYSFSLIISPQIRIFKLYIFFLLLASF